MDVESNNIASIPSKVFFCMSNFKNMIRYFFQSLDRLNTNTQRILHGRAEIRNFSSSVEKYFTSERSERVKYFQHERKKFVSPSGHVKFYLLYKHQ